MVFLKIPPAAFVLGAALAMLDAANGAAATRTATDEVILLPEYTVTAERELPPPEAWRYARIPGLQILSNASDSATEQIVRDFRMFDLAMRVVWPVLEKSDLEIRLILCGAGGKFDEFAEGRPGAPAGGTASLCLHDRDKAAIIIDLQTRVLNLVTPEQIAAFTAPVPETDTASSGDDLLPGFAIDHYKQLKREYIRLLLGRIQPRAPAWLEEGLVQMFMTMQVERRSIVFGRVEDPNLLTVEEQTNAINAATAPADIGATQVSAPAEDRDFNKTLSQRGIMPLGDFFAVTHDASAVLNPIGGTWAKQAQGFVHMCMYGRGGRYQAGFIKFVTRLAREPASEALFRECFGRTYRAMETELRGYVEFTDHKFQEFRAKGDGLPEIARLELRAATQAEIGRIKGEALALAGKPEAARNNLLAAYLRGEREPELLAALGRAEKLAGHNERALQLLESACASKVPDAHAHLDLARLRLATFQEQPVRADRNLPAEQVVAVLRPLFAARQYPPPLPEVYELIADVWTHAAAKPTRENLAVLDEGVRLFPRRGSLIVSTATLHARHGFAAEASALIEFGLQTVRDPAAIAALTALQATLPRNAR